MREVIGVVAGISGKEIVCELKKLGYDTLVIGGRENEAGMEESTFKYTIDLRKKEEILDVLKKNNVKKLIVGTGHILAFELAEYLLANNIKTSINPQSSLLAKDKFLYKEKLEEIGFKTPKYILLKNDDNIDIEKLIEKIGIPCVVKSPIDTMLPSKANTLEELEECIIEVKKTGSEILIEEFVDGIDITVPVISNYEGQKAVMLSYYNKSKACKLKGFEVTKDGSTLPREIEEKVLKLSEEIMEKTKMLGLGRLDIIVNKNYDFYILECNSVMVTGVHPNQIEYGTEFLQKEEVNFAEILVRNALTILQ